MLLMFCFLKWLFLLSFQHILMYQIVLPFTESKYLTTKTIKIRFYQSFQSKFIIKINKRRNSLRDMIYRYYQVEKITNPSDQYLYSLLILEASISASILDLLNADSA